MSVGLQRLTATSTNLTIATTAYIAGDQVNASLSVAGAAHVSGGGGYVTGLTIVDVSSITSTLFEVYLFPQLPVATAGDNSPWSMSDADMLTSVGPPLFTSGIDSYVGGAIQGWTGMQPYSCTNGTSLGFVLRAVGARAVFAAVTDLQIAFYCDVRN